MKTIHTAKAPEAIGPYSQAIVHGGLLFTSGQIAINPASGQVEADTIEGQTEQVMQNLAALLEEAGASLQRDQNHLFPQRYGGFRRVQRHLRRLFCQQARPLLRGGQTAAQKRAGGSRAHRRRLTAGYFPAGRAVWVSRRFFMPGSPLPAAG